MAYANLRGGVGSAAAALEAFRIHQWAELLVLAVLTVYVLSMGNWQTD